MGYGTTCLPQNKSLSRENPYLVKIPICCDVKEVAMLWRGHCCTKCTRVSILTSGVSGRLYSVSGQAHHYPICLLKYSVWLIPKSLD